MATVAATAGDYPNAPDSSRGDVWISRIASRRVGKGHPRYSLRDVQAIAAGA